MSVYPIAITKADWKVYNLALEEAIGQRATYKTDSKNLKIDGLATFYHSFDHKNGDMLDWSLQHGMFTALITEVSQGAIVNLTQGWDCTFTHGDMKDGEGCYLILSATISAWLQFLRLSCDATNKKKIRQIGNEIYTLLDRVGFGPAFSYTRYTLPDGTFELCKGK